MAETTGVHQLHAQRSDLTNVKALLRRDIYWTGYVRAISPLYSLVYRIYRC